MFNLTGFNHARLSPLSLKKRGEPFQTPCGMALSHQQEMTRVKMQRRKADAGQGYRVMIDRVSDHGVVARTDRAPPSAAGPFSRTEP
jgi:hypothetical protein